MNKLISVIIPVKNGENYLGECIKSVKKQNMDVEIIVIDDGSTDNTAKLAQENGAIVYSIPHAGLSAARNVGLKNCHGEYVLFIDHDDLLTDNALNTLYQAIETNQEIDYVQGKLKDFISPELNDAEKKMLAPRAEPYGGLLTGAFLFKKSAIDIIGGFDENLQTGQGVDFLLKAEKNQLKTTKIDFITTLRRFHNNNMGRTMQQTEFKDYASILRAKLKRGGGKPLLVSFSQDEAHVCACVDACALERGNSSSVGLLFSSAEKI